MVKWFDPWIIPLVDTIYLLLVDPKIESANRFFNLANILERFLLACHQERLKIFLFQLS